MSLTIIMLSPTLGAAATVVSTYVLSVALCIPSTLCLCIVNSTTASFAEVNGLSGILLTPAPTPAVYQQYHLSFLQ